jgi:hypothetical protein
MRTKLAAKTEDHIQMIGQAKLFHSRGEMSG